MTVEEATQRLHAAARAWAAASLADVERGTKATDEAAMDAESELLEAAHEFAALAAAEKDGWRPIETANRKDMDTVIQLWCPYEGIFNGAAREIGFAKRPGWRVMAYPYQGADDSAGNALTNETATHWRPLPAPPSEG